jgi:hypothetical protein
MAEPLSNLYCNFFDREFFIRCVGSQLRCLTLWWGADDVMLQILSDVCPSLQLLDVWKSARVTDQGLRSLLGLDILANQQAGIN